MTRLIGQPRSRRGRATAAWAALVTVLVVALVLFAYSRRQTQPPPAQTANPSVGAPASVPPATSPPPPAGATTPPKAAIVPEPSGSLVVHFIDVGQGDSILIQAPDGKVALIDGGVPGSGALAYLRTQQIKRVDVLIATHPHQDHVGGLAEVLEALPVGEVWTSGASHTTRAFERFVDAITRAKVPYKEAKRGDTIPLGELAFEVLHAQKNASDLNDTSVVVRLRYGAVAFLFTGDATRVSEKMMLAAGRDKVAATVLKVGHHGSRTSCTPEFLAAVAPKVAVYCAGARNSYGHPHAQTIAALKAAGAEIYGTATHGTVVISTDGKNYKIETSKVGSARGPPTDSMASSPQ